MKRATEAQFDELHNLITTEFLARIKSGEATAKGKKRGAMTPAARAKSRAVKKSGGKPSDYTYNRKTNTTKKY